MLLTDNLLVILTWLIGLLLIHRNKGLKGTDRILTTLYLKLDFNSKLTSSFLTGNKTLLALTLEYLKSYFDSIHSH